MTADAGCPICQDVSAKTSSLPRRDAYQCHCPQCGEFRIDRSAKVNLSRSDYAERQKVSAWVVQNQPQVVTIKDTERAIDSLQPSLSQRAERMLRFIVTCFPPGALFSLPDSAAAADIGSYAIPDSTGEDVYYLKRLKAVGWNQSRDETLFMLTEVLCNEMGLLVSQNNHDYRVSPKGLLHLEGRREGPSLVGFCAMWFSPEVETLWTDVITHAIKDAGYEPLRIDEQPHNGKIDDAIMAAIRAARFVVSDFTGSRGGVYYEAGFAHGLGLPVIFMCRDGDELHFDVRQYNCIFWKANDLADARERLKNRIVATLGQGPKAPK